MFQVQAFLVADRVGAVLVLTVTTPDPSREHEARSVAREVAATMRLVEVEAQPASRPQPRGLRRYTVFERHPGVLIVIGLLAGCSTLRRRRSPVTRRPTWCCEAWLLR